LRNKLFKIIFLSSLLLFLNTNKIIANESKIKVFYSGFSFANSYFSNKDFAKYSEKIIKIKNDSSINIISARLLSSLQDMYFDNIILETKSLISLKEYPDNAVLMSIALQHEEFTQEYNQSTNIYSGFYDAYFNILFYDFSDQSLIASIPFDFEIQMMSEEELTQKNIVNRIKEFYLEDNPFQEIQKLINSFNVKRKYDRRIGVTNVEVNNRTFEYLPTNYIKNLEFVKNLIAQTFSKRLSKHHNVAIVPYTEGQAIGGSMKLRFVETDEIYSIKLLDPDYHINLNLLGFKKVLASSSEVNDLYLYGSFINIKIFQPDIEKIYFEETLRGVTDIKIPKSQTEINEWRKFYYNLEILLDDFSKNILKPDKKWMKKASKNKFRKDLIGLNDVLDKVK